MDIPSKKNIGIGNTSLVFTWHRIDTINPTSDAHPCHRAAEGGDVSCVRSRLAGNESELNSVSLALEC